MPKRGSTDGNVHSVLKSRCCSHITIPLAWPTCAVRPARAWPCPLMNRWGGPGVGGSAMNSRSVPLTLVIAPKLPFMFRSRMWSADHTHSKYIVVLLWCSLCNTLLLRAGITHDVRLHDTCNYVYAHAYAEPPTLVKIVEPTSDLIRFCTCALTSCVETAILQLCFIDNRP